MTLAPLADVDIPTGAFTGRLFSSDAGVVAQFTAAAVAGYNDAHFICAPGHFPGAGAASADPDQMTATVGGSLAQLRQRDLVPFAAVASHVPVILMSNAAYVAFDGVTPASLLPQAVALLRTAYRFTGVIMSDDLDATLDPTGSTVMSVALQALQAGDDLLYITGPQSERTGAYQAVLAAARRSARVRTLVQQALLRDLSLKARYGILKG
jgi:beta-N-acetylhexosaminidase